MAQRDSVLGVPTEQTTSQRRLWSNVGWLVGLFGVYLGLRLPALLRFPLFNDEAMYLMRARHFPTMIQGTLVNGKLLQELFLAVLVNLPGDPVFLSRFLSVLCGAGTLIGMLLIARALDHPEVGVVAGMLYATSPMGVFFDRLALPDSMLTCVACFILLKSVTFIQTPQPSRKQAALLGALIGLASLVKMTGLFLFALPVLMTFLMPAPWPERRNRLFLLRTTLIAALVFVAVLAPFHYGGIERDYAQTPSLSQKVVIFGHNLAYVGELLLFYLPGFLLLPAVVLLIGVRHQTTAHRPILLLTVSGGILIATFLVISNTIHSRYLMPAWPALLLASAMSLTSLWQFPGKKPLLTRTVCLAAVGLALAWNSYFAVQLVRDPASTPLVATDRRGYLENWTAGYHLSELMGVIAAETQRQGQITLVNHARGRLIHMAAKFYLAEHPGITIIDIDLTAPEALPQLQQLMRDQPTYLLLDGEEYDLLNVPQRFPQATVVQYVEHPTSSMRFYLVFYGGTPLHPGHQQE